MMLSIPKRSLAPILALGLLAACVLAAPAQAAPQQAEPTLFGISWSTHWLPSWLHDVWGSLGDPSGTDSLDTETDEPGRLFDRAGAVLEPDGAPTATQENDDSPSFDGHGG